MDGGLRRKFDRVLVRVCVCARRAHNLICVLDVQRGASGVERFRPKCRLTRCLFTGRAIPNWFHENVRADLRRPPCGVDGSRLDLRFGAATGVDPEGFLAQRREGLRSRARRRANIAHIRQSRPDSGRGFPVKVVKFYLHAPPFGCAGYGGVPIRDSGAEPRESLGVFFTRC